MSIRCVRWTLVAIFSTFVAVGLLMHRDFLTAPQAVVLEKLRKVKSIPVLPSAPNEETLLETLQGIDRIRVRTGGTCHREIASEKTLFETTEFEQIAEVIGSIQIDQRDKECTIHCQCCGNPSFEFYRRGVLVVTLGYHHGRSLRWREGWVGDGLLTKESAVKTNAWLLAQGVKIR